MARYAGMPSVEDMKSVIQRPYLVLHTHIETHAYYVCRGVGTLRRNAVRRGHEKRITKGRISPRWLRSAPVYLAATIHEESRSASKLCGAYVSVCLSMSCLSACICLVSVHLFHVLSCQCTCLLLSYCWPRTRGATAACKETNENRSVYDMLMTTRQRSSCVCVGPCKGGKWRPFCLRYVHDNESAKICCVFMCVCILHKCVYSAGGW